MSSRAPEHPSGCPSAIAPPFALSRSSSASIPQLVGHGQRLSREGLVQLDQVDVVEAQPGPLQRLRGRRHRADAHDPRRHSGHGHRAHLGERRQPVRLGVARARDHHRGRAVVERARVARGDGAVLLEHRLQLRERLQRRVAARPLVGLDHGVALAAVHGHRHGLLVEAPGVDRRHGLLVAVQREAVLAHARDLALLGEVLRGDAERVGVPAPLHLRVGHAPAERRVVDRAVARTGMPSRASA